VDKSLDSIAPKFKSILENTEPYILSYPGNWERYNFNPWGVEVKEENRFSCISLKSEKFTDLLFDLDGLAFGPMGMPMEKWVFFDCGEMPGGIVGFGVRTNQLSDEALKEFHVDRSYEGLIPISMYIAIPVNCGNLWFGHNLSSANRILDPKMPGLGLLTKAFALRVLNIEEMLGATQWDSKALNIHLQLGDMDIESAYTPAHKFKNTTTYHSIYKEENLIAALNGKRREAPDYDFLYPPEDEAFSRQIQERIEKGEKFRIVGRSIQKDGVDWHPVKEIK
jgi:hypothetical protein